MRRLRIAIDFDGTIVSLRYPEIGMLIEGVEYINEWYKHHTIIVNTCRSGEHAEAAEKFLINNGIKFHLFNENDPELINIYGSDTRKISADYYPDDKSAYRSFKHHDRIINRLATMKPMIVCIVGESGSGKTTLADLIEKRYGIPMINSYTNRPKRKDTETGHVFIEPAEFDLLKIGDMIAYTEWKGYRYCCLTSDVQLRNTYVIDESGLRMLTEHYSDVYDIRTVRLHCNLKERQRRIKDQERLSRDRGKFTILDEGFDLVAHTDRNDTVHIADVVYDYFNMNIYA